jgi:lysophospholipase L1-like esterase
MKLHAGGQPNNRLVFFGDSICVGQGVSIHRGWVTRVAAHLEKRSVEGGIDLVVVNASINGNTTRQALERMPYDVQSHGVGVLIIQFGMNDCNYWSTDGGVPRVSPPAFAANLAEIVQRGILFGARAVLLNTNHPTTRTRDRLANSNVSYEDSNRTYNQLIREVAGEFRQVAILTDVERAFHDHTGGREAELARLLLGDGLHLSAEGHDLYYTLMAPAMDLALQRVYGL